MNLFVKLHIVLVFSRIECNHRNEFFFANVSCEEVTSRFVFRSIWTTICSLALHLVDI